MQLRLERPGGDDPRDESDEPGCRPPNTLDQQCAERGGERPERDGARRAEAAQAGLQQEGQDQCHRQVSRAERREAPRARQRHEPDDGDHLVDEGNGA